MHSYAQTNLQLFNQLRRDGYSKADLELVRDAYELTMVLFGGRFQPSGKSFIAHVVGTASILASLRLPAPVVAAGLLHNAYQNGDFGDGCNDITKARRRKLLKVLGPEVENYVAKFQALYWEPRTTRIAREQPDQLKPVERNVLLILFADHLEHLLDHDILYYPDSLGRSLLARSEIAAEIAAGLGLPGLAAQLREAIRETLSADAPVKLLERRTGSFVVAPRSCRMRARVVLRQELVHAAQYARRKLSRAVRSFTGNHPRTDEGLLSAIPWFSRSTRRKRP
jgi:(p)ppGpp synthase/HD superfamily hydrolase